MNKTELIEKIAAGSGLTTTPVTRSSTISSTKKTKTTIATSSSTCPATDLPPIVFLMPTIPLLLLCRIALSMQNMSTARLSSVSR